MNFTGLTSKQARENLETYGLNEIIDISKVSPLKILFSQIKKNFIIYILLFAMIVSFFVGKSITAYTILFVILLVIIVGFVQEYRAEKAISSLKKMITPVSIVIRDNKEHEVLSNELVPDDILLLRSGERVPADCIILEQSNLILDESILTGESKEVTKNIAPENYTDEETIFMGTFVVNGKCTAKVIHTGMNTKFGKIAKMISKAEKELPLQKKVNDIAKYMAVIAIVFSVLTGFIMFLNTPATDGFFVEILILVIALMVSAFPESFPVVLITALSAGAYQMAKKNAIVNRMSIIETLGETTVICSDKTGTITKGEMTANKIFADNNFYDISGTGFNSEGDFFHNDKKINIMKNKTLNLIMKTSVLCNNAIIERTGFDSEYNTHGSPTESALLIMSSKANLFREDTNAVEFEEISFNSERKMMSVIYNENNKLKVYSKGAPEILLDKCKYILKKDKLVKLNEKEKKLILDANHAMNTDSLRTISIAYKEAGKNTKNFEEDLVFLGLVGIYDPPRENVKESIKTCFGAGIAVKMITGDNKDTALSIANQIDLEGNVLEGWELDNITDEELITAVKSVTIFARVKPDHKIRIVKALKESGEIVTMTGDGVNDAPALKEAHIGVAMGKAGTDVSRSVSDLILKDDDFSTIVSAIREGRTIFKNIRKFISYQLSCNFAELTILFFGVVFSPIFGWQIPLLLALHILFMNLVTDDFPAIALSLNPLSKDAMSVKPRKNESILTKSLIFLIIIAGALMFLFTFGAYYLAFNILGYSVIKARTFALLVLIALEITGAYNFRSYRQLVSFTNLSRNKYLFYASIISILATLAIIYTPLNIIFETTPLGAFELVVASLAGITYVLIFNILKYINNKKNFLKID